MPRAYITQWDQPVDWASWTTWLYSDSVAAVPDYFHDAKTIRERLTQTVTVCRRVYDVASIGAALELIHESPAIFVVPWDDVVFDADPSGVVSMSNMSWLVLVVTRQIDKVEYGADALREAGKIATQVMQSLQGFVLPANAHIGLRRVNAPKLGDHGALTAYEKGVSVIPLCFSLPIYHEGSVNAS